MGPFFSMTGFTVVTFLSRIKPETKGVIRQLNSANLRTIMITGDNINTAISVAKECGMVKPGELGFESEPPAAGEMRKRDAELQTFASRPLTLFLFPPGKIIVVTHSEESAGEQLKGGFRGGGDGEMKLNFHAAGEVRNGGVGKNADDAVVDVDRG